MGSNSKNNMVKKVIAFIFLGFIFLMTMLIGSGFNLHILNTFLDVPSLTFIIVSAICIMVLADSFSDYIRALKFYIAGGNTDFTTMELKSSLKSCEI